jgi:hypothetical protein
MTDRRDEQSYVDGMQAGYRLGYRDGAEDMHASVELEDVATNLRRKRAKEARAKKKRSGVAIYIDAITDTAA